MIKKLFFLIVILAIVLVIIGFVNSKKQDQLLNSIDQVEVTDSDISMDGSDDSFDTHKVEVRDGQIVSSGDHLAVSDYSLTFTGFAVGKSHVTEFKNSDIELYLDDNGENVGGKIIFYTDSIYSEDGDKLVEHLKTDDFLGVESNPTISFTSENNSISLNSGDSVVQVKGDLSFLGQTKSVQFPVSISKEGDLSILVVDASLDLKDFGFNPEPLAKSEVRIEGKIKFEIK